MLETNDSIIQNSEKNKSFFGLKKINETLNMTKYNYIFELISDNYFDEKILDQEKMIEESIKWLVEWVWDKHTSYLSSEENKSFQESLSGDFEWIWAVVEMNNIWVLVDRIIKGSPAKKNDIRSWDIIITANWEKLEWLSLYDAVWLIKWEAGTIVDLDILRKGESEVLNKKVTREKIKIPSVETELLEDNIWYISLNMFWENTHREFLNSLEELWNVDWYVLDLRDNWGWYLIIAVNILSSFIKSWETVVQTRYRESSQNSDYFSFWSEKQIDKKIVVLINENSASASEITAWALRDYNKAIIVWKKSYWKWSVQHPYTLSDWSMVKITIAKWFTPLWTSIDEAGIIPDIEVWFLEEDFENKYDRQKETSIEILKTFMKNNSINLTIEKFTNEEK